jgi:hypothetical protein
LTLEADQRLPQHALVERHRLGRPHVPGHELLGSQVHDRVVHPDLTSPVTARTGSAAKHHVGYGRSRPIPALPGCHRHRLERLCRNQDFLDAPGRPGRQHPIEPEGDLAGGRIGLDVRHKRRTIGKALGQAERDPFRVDRLKDAEPEAARRHHMIEAVGIEQVLHLVDRDGKPDLRSLAQLRLDDADREAVAGHQRTAAVPWIQAVGDLQVAPIARVVGAQRRNRAGRRAHVGNHIRRGGDSSDLDFTAEWVPERIHRKSGRDHIGVSEREVRKIGGSTNEQDREIESGIRRRHRGFGARRGHAARGHRLSAEADVDRRHLERDGGPLQAFGEPERFAVLDDMGVGEHVPVGRDDEAAPGAHLDALLVQCPLDPALVELGVNTANQANEDRRVGGRFGALRGGGAWHEYQGHRQRKCFHGGQHFTPPSTARGDDRGGDEHDAEQGRPDSPPPEER